MKRVLLGTSLLVIGLLAVGMAWAGDDIPNLVGTWESQMATNHMHSAEKGHKSPFERFVIIVEGQEGRAFFGHKEKFVGTKMVETEKFSGVIYWDNKTIYLADHDKGYNQGTIESPTEIRGVYMEEGPKAMVVLLTWKKVK
jgi:hypothetical protein